MRGDHLHHGVEVIDSHNNTRYHNTAGIFGRPEPKRRNDDQGGVLVIPRNRPVEFEARDLLASQGYYVLRYPGSTSPVNLVGLCPDDLLLIQVRRTRKDLSIREVHAHYSRDMDQIRRIGGPRDCRKELWIYAPSQGWHFYEVFPGGVMERDGA
jgi:hypothetical protein